METCVHTTTNLNTLKENEWQNNTPHTSFGKKYIARAVDVVSPREIMDIGEKYSLLPFQNRS